MFQSSYNNNSSSDPIKFQTFLDLLKNSAKTATPLLEIDLLHSLAIKVGFMQNPEVGIGLLNLYVKCRCFDRALQLFDLSPKRDVRAWTILIAGYTRMGLSKFALELLSRMQIEGVYPNCFTLASIFKCCAGAGDLKTGKEAHGWIIRNGVELDVSLENSIIDFYVKCGVFNYAGRVFEMMDEMDTVSWNIMIGAYLQIGNIERSMELFKRLPFRDVASWNTMIVGQMRNGFDGAALELLYQMTDIGLKFNEFTFSVALGLVATLEMLELGRQIHAQVLRLGFKSDLFIRNSLIDMYCKCGEMEHSTTIFNEMHLFSENKKNSRNFDGLPANTVSWSIIIAGYIQSGRYEDALNFFRKMHSEGVSMDPFTFASIASACANAGVLEQGKQIHACIEKCEHRLDVFLASAIIDMYAKCGSIGDARAVFDGACVRTVVMWTTILSGYALHGQGREAIRLFELMLKENIRPNEITFVGVLSACSHAGLVEEGHTYFKSMQEEHGIVPSVEHFTCMVDLLGRAGHFDVVKSFIHNNNISHVSVVWQALLSACCIHNNIEMGKWASKKLAELEPHTAGSYILLSNICGTTQMWEEAEKVRKMMKEKGIRKEPGQSWIQLKNNVHTFVVSDRSHPQSADIYLYLECLIGMINEIGYSSDTNMVLLDVEGE